MDKLKCDRHIGDIIRNLRISKGLQQADVITYMQLKGVPMTKSSYSKLESNKQHIKINELIALKKYFGVTYDDFFIELE